MKCLITGICGYVGSHITQYLRDAYPEINVFGIDNLSRRGSEQNIKSLRKLEVPLYHGDVRQSSDLHALPAADWVIDCAANPSVTAGVNNGSGCTVEQLIQNNLIGTLNLLEYCRRNSAGFLLLSTSRVYNIDTLLKLPLYETSSRFSVLDNQSISGFSSFGIAESFSTITPLSLYGATKYASEVMALEYGNAFNIPIWINRCGVIGGPGQFGKIDQGIFAFWVYSCAIKKPLKYIGFDGKGKQVRDVVNAEDIARLIGLQINDPYKIGPRVLNIGGGNNGSMSLFEITQYCEEYFNNPISIESSIETRRYDIPYYVTDYREAEAMWNWCPTENASQIVYRLCGWAEKNKEFILNLFE